MNKTLFIGIDPSITILRGNEDHNGIVITNNIFNEYSIENFIKTTISTPKTLVNIQEKIDFVYNEILKEVNNFMNKTGVNNIKEYDYVFLFIEEYKQQSFRSKYQAGTSGDPMMLLITSLEWKAKTALKTINAFLIQRQQSKYILDSDLIDYKLLTHQEKVPLHERDACRVLITGQNKIKSSSLRQIINSKGEKEYE